MEKDKLLLVPASMLRTLVDLSEGYIEERIIDGYCDNEEEEEVIEQAKKLLGE